ncbi:lysophospholipid acyltransferase family protein [Sphingosinicella sp. LHD-64]|uniref:lysophospholipid acyltransferase family protein n=1 Tax=Sphingosinicella sp. LHD-64 TaxID=3072139 RepID=UPI00280FC80B|nr:lysophospholipid acyltransferase family protein [Sphingosinicella sp. LHD-64]MDQ8755851.1 lysophospholipid acyltransferase family protein [Sphingosinicella sp. LHD-64]
MNLLRSTLFALVFYAWTVIAVLLSFPIGLFGQRAIRGWAHLWVRFHRTCARHLLGIRTVVEGAPPAGAVLAAAKHQSMFETLELLLMFNEPAVVLKRELAAIPLWGWVVRRYGVIPVDRGAGATALRRMMRAAEAAIAEGRPILIFPEGTRVPVGETPPLQPGFAGLYRALGLPVAPIALDSGRLWPRNSFVKRPGIVTMRFLPPVPPGLPRREMEAQVHTAINALEMKA